MRKDHGQVRLVVNGEEVDAHEGQTLLQRLHALRIHVPSFCYHPGSERQLRCRLCLVDVNGELKTSCTELVVNGMVVQTDTPAIRQARRDNLQELTDLYYDPEMCSDCIWDSGCELHMLAVEYGIDLHGERRLPAHPPTAG